MFVKQTKKTFQTNMHKEQQANKTKWDKTKQIMNKTTKINVKLPHF